MSYQMRFSKDGTVVVVCVETSNRWDMTPDEADMMAFAAMKQIGKDKELSFRDLDGYVIELSFESADDDFSVNLFQLSNAARQQLGQRAH